MASSSSSSTTDKKAASMLNDLKTGAKGIHGIGETIRGTFNEAIDTTLTPHNASANNTVDHPTANNMAKNRAIAEQGEQDIARASGRFATASTNTNTTVKTGGLSSNNNDDATPTTTTKTAAGTHSTAVGNLGTDSQPTGTVTSSSVGTTGQEEDQTSARY